MATGVLVAALTTAAHTQSLADLAAVEAKRRGATPTAKKVYTTADLPAAPAPTVISPEIIADPRRQEAIGALGALQSVTDGGANISEFKRYYLEAKVKVDALANIPENATIREVCDIYGDAVRLKMATIGTVSLEDRVAIVKLRDKVQPHRRSGHEPLFSRRRRFDLLR